MIEEDKRRRRRGLFFFLLFSGIVLLGSLLPVLLVNEPVSINTTETSTSTETITSTQTSTSTPTSTSTQTSTSTETTTSFNTVNPAPNPFIMAISDNYIDLDNQENRFVYLNYSFLNPIIYLNVIKQDKMGNLIWRTEFPCLYNPIPASLNNGMVTIDQDTHEVYVFTLCLNFTTNMTKSYALKLSQTGSLIWTKELDQFPFDDVPSPRATIFNNTVYFFKSGMTPVEISYWGLNKNDGTRLYNTSLYNNCGNTYITTPNIFFIVNRPAYSTIVRNNSIHVVTYFMYFGSYYPPPPNSSDLTNFYNHRYCVRNFNSDLSLNYQNWTFLYSVSYFQFQPIYPTEELCPSISAYDYPDLVVTYGSNFLLYNTLPSDNWIRNSWVNQTTGDLYVLAPSSICRYSDMTSAVSYTNYSSPLSNTTTFAYQNGFSFYNDRLYGFASSTPNNANSSQYVYGFTMNPLNQSIVFTTPLLSYSASTLELPYRTSNWTSFTIPMYNGDGILYSGALSKNTRVNNTMNIGLYSRSI